MKLEIHPPLLFIFCYFIFLSNQTIRAESIANIEYPKISIKNDKGDELIQIQAVAQLSSITINGSKISELSDLAWDEDENLLYALSDNGHILSFRAIFKEGLFHDLLLINGIPFRDNRGKKLRWENSDSEGLTLINSDNQIQGDTKYIVSFERQPRIIQYNQKGFIEKPIEIPEKLKDITNYRSENKSLESIVMHEKYGLLIGTEYSLQEEDKNQLGFYTQDGTFRSFSTHFSGGALTGLTIIKKNQLMAIERVYGGFLSGFKVALHHLQIQGDQLKDKVIAKFLPAEGIFNDNFEGIGKHKDNFYFMISDDNNHPIKQTVLIYFKYEE